MRGEEEEEDEDNFPPGEAVLEGHGPPDKKVTKKKVFKTKKNKVVTVPKKYKRTRTKRGILCSISGRSVF